MHPLEPDPPSSPPRTPVCITIKSLGTSSWSFRPDRGHGNVGVVLQHDLYPPLMFLLPFTIQEGIRIPEHWTGVWERLMAWPGNRDLSGEQWILLSQTLRIFYYFAHQERETIAAWPSFMKAYLLVGEIGASFGGVVAGCGEIQLGFLIAWVGSRLGQESLAPYSTFFQPPSEVDAAATLDSKDKGNVVDAVPTVDVDNQGSVEEDESSGRHFV